MALWTDIIDPATLTGYARRAQQEYEAAKGTLARWLPNQEVADIVARFVVGQSGLVEEARYRAYDAEPEVGRPQQGRRVTLELPAISQNIPVTEYQQLRTRNASDDQVLNAILKTTSNVVAAICDRSERTRGVVLATGRATVAQSNFGMNDDFGRAPGHTFTAAALWNTAGADRLGHMQTAFDLYVAANGVPPGALVGSTRVLRAMQSGTQFSTSLAGGGSRNATAAEVSAAIEGAGLPAFYAYDRRTSAGRVLPDDVLLFLPAPTDPNGGDSELGATFWGQTLTSTDSRYSIEPAEQPGIVTGVYRGEKPPMIAEVVGDSISLPVLANANLSVAMKVL